MQHRAYVMRLKREHVADYVEVHRKAKLWQSILEALKTAKVEKLIILLHGQDVILFEEAEDLKATYRFYDSDPAAIKWDQMMTKWMEVYPHFNELKGDVEFAELPVVFYYENGTLRH